MTQSGGWRPAWFAGVGLGLLVSVAFAFVPAGTTTATLAYQGIAGAIVLVMLVIVVRRPARHRGIWVAVWGYALLALAGDVAYYAETLAGVEQAWLSHVLYFAGYGCALVALLLLGRAVHPGRNVEAAIDTLILTIALASILYLLIIEPTVDVYAGDTRGTLLAIAYPLVDLLLLSWLIRVLVGSGPINPAVGILLAGFAITFVADLFYAWVGAGGLDGVAPPWLDSLYLVAFVLLAASAAAPGADLPEPAAPASDVAVPRRTMGLTVGALIVPVLLLVAALQGDADAARVLAVASVLVILLVLWRFQTLLAVIDRQSQRMSSLARMDALTGLPNRRTLDHQLERMDQTPLDQPVTVAMLDLDRFKSFNDAYGHAAGDAVLVACAAAWSAALARLAVPGVLARYGGEEFAILLPGLDRTAATPVLEDLRSATPAGHTVSIGSAQVEPGEAVFTAMGRADRALYAAKRAGRDRVVFDGPDRTPAGP